jgi:hypothetical protein
MLLVWFVCLFVWLVGWLVGWLVVWIYILHCFSFSVNDQVYTPQLPVNIKR